MKHAAWAIVVAVMGMTAVGLASMQAPQAVPSDPPSQSDKATRLDEDSARLDEISARLERVEARLARRTSGALLLLFGAFCALWAQYSKRNPWLWFGFGAIFNILALPVLLMKNADTLKGIKPTRRRSLVQAAVFTLLLAGVAAGLWLDSKL